MPSTADPLPGLETPCPSCRGRGEYWSDDCDSRRGCETCGGAGFVPTDLGERILALMRHNFRPMLEDLQSDRT